MTETERIKLNLLEVMRRENLQQKDLYQVFGVGLSTIDRTLNVEGYNLSPDTIKRIDKVYNSFLAKWKTEENNLEDLGFI